jgi:AbrB family looped-hinge helix DNA binding protein
MGTKSTLTSKGRTTIPKDIRDCLGLSSGDRITFTMMRDGTVQIRAKNRSAFALGGSLRKKGQIRLPSKQLSR